MKKLITFLFLITAFLASSVHAQSTPEPIVDYINVPIKTTSGKKLSNNEIRQAIMRAGTRLNWQFSETPERLVGTLMVRSKHVISVNIEQTPETYSITYKDSVNMNYGARSQTADTPFLERINPNIKTAPTDPNAKLIHHSYNNWVKSLVNAINVELGRN